MAQPGSKALTQVCSTPSIQEIWVQGETSKGRGNRQGKHHLQSQEAACVGNTFQGLENLTSPSSLVYPDLANHPCFLSSLTASTDPPSNGFDILDNKDFPSLMGLSHPIGWGLPTLIPKRNPHNAGC